MKLEVGMYVRWKRFSYSQSYLIGQIKEINKCWIYLDTTYDNGGFITETNIKKASFNIIDLIEVGDYVNGFKIQKLVYGQDIEGDKTIGINGFGHCDYEIKEILTHEQYEANCYKVVE